MGIVWLTIEIVVLLCCAAFFSGSETAVTAISRPEYRSLKKTMQKNAQRLARLVEIKEHIVIVALIGTNFVNMLNSGLITAFTLTAFGAYAVPVATAVITVLIIIVAEIFPKALATEQALAFGKIASLPLLACYTVLRPVSAVFSVLSKGIIALLSLTAVEKPAVLHKKDLQLLVHISQQDGALKAGEEALLQQAILLQNVPLRTIMTPRSRIAAVSIQDSFETLIRQFCTSRFSRLPVYNQDARTVRGIVYYKDVLFSLYSQKPKCLEDLIKPALFIPEQTSLFSVIETMKAHRQNMAIVIDGYGGITGLITEDDITAAVFSHSEGVYRTMFYRR
ncbi:MAG: hemolysin family protein [Treponema sp.]